MSALGQGFVRWICFLVFLSNIAAGQAPKPAQTFQLHTDKMPSWKWMTLTMAAGPPGPDIEVTSDRHTLLALIPHEKREWELQKLTGWETGQPQVQSLRFQGDDSEDQQDYITGSLFGSPDGTSELVRIGVYHLRDHTRSVVIVLVNLQNFQVVWRRVSTDPLLANSRWRFAPDGRLIVAEGPNPDYSKKYSKLAETVPSDVLSMNPSAPGSHKATAVSFPALEPGQPCVYTVPQEIETRDPGYDDPNDPEYAPDLKPASSAAEVTFQTPGCHALMDAAGRATVTGLTDLVGGEDRILLSLLPGCRLSDQNMQSKLTMYDCDVESIKANGAKVMKSDVRVVRAPQGDEVISVPLHSPQYSAFALAESGGRGYLIVMRQTLSIEVYPLK